MPTPSDDQQLIISFAQIWTRIEQRLDASLSNIKGISFSEYRMLRHLADAPNRSASRVDVANALARTPSGITRALKPLEKLGMVVSHKSDRDARLTLAHLTDQGQTLVEDSCDLLNDVTADILSSVSDRHREMIANALGALNQR